MAFLPKSYTAPAGSNSFMKFTDGDNRFRILSEEAAIGWEGWKDNKPFRREGIEKNINDSEVDTDSKYGPEKPKINHFWAFLVYNYTTKAIEILEITQKTVMKKIQALSEDEDWGNPNGYDLNVVKEDKGGRISYDVTAYPPKPVSKEVATAHAATDISVESLFEDDADDAFRKHVPSKKK